MKNSIKIALIGYGKMGKTIERIAISRGHEVVLKIDDQNLAEFTPENLQKADVAIEFTRPEAAVRNIETLLAAGVPTVCGTTGWLTAFERIKSLCEGQNGAFFYASNFSVGVNIFFAVNRYLATMMNEQTQYNASMKEIHHTQKLDAPSGTAITLAEGILDNIKRLTHWVNETSVDASALGIISERVDPAPGTHVVTYESAVDSIEITHTAHSREGFATGAVVAAEWLVDKKGVFSMKDMLGF
jgi:4-hydroxy-tetrahydrodipicolinate reductase